MSATEIYAAILALDAIDGGDPEAAHGEADHIILSLVPIEVRNAYERLTVRCDWWATA